MKKKNEEIAEVLIIRSRYVLPGTNGRVAFSLNPTADVGPPGVVPSMGGRLVMFWAKYISAESTVLLRTREIEVVERTCLERVRRHLGWTHLYILPKECFVLYGTNRREQQRTLRHMNMLP